MKKQAVVKIYDLFLENCLKQHPSGRYDSIVYL